MLWFRSESASRHCCKPMTTTYWAWRPENNATLANREVGFGINCGGEA